MLYEERLAAAGPRPDDGVIPLGAVEEVDELGLPTLTLHLMTRAADYFKSGISVAANTDFLFYDSIWSERYFGLPQDNLEAYINSSAKTYAHLLKGNLLLVHGMEDDNVHYQHTMQMAKKLQDAGKQFELMLYPNKNHSIQGPETQKHLYEMMTNFFLRTL